MVFVGNILSLVVSDGGSFTWTTPYFLEIAECSVLIMTLLMVVLFFLLLIKRCFAGSYVWWEAGDDWGCEAVCCHGLVAFIKTKIKLLNSSIVTTSLGALDIKKKKNQNPNPVIFFSFSKDADFYLFSS